jgi:hypothetical protein
MNHLLLGFALCATLAIYPGGLAALVAALAGGVIQFWPGNGEGWGRQAWLPGSLGGFFLGLALAGLALAPMPWPDSPVAPIAISWAAGSSVGGITLTLVGLWLLQLLGSKQPEQGWHLGLVATWSMGLVSLALAVHSGSWSGVLNAGGLGAELGRVCLATLGLVLLPLVLRRAPGGVSLSSAAWAAGTGVALLLALPQIQATPFPVAIAAWWGLMAAIGLGWAASARWGPSIIRNLGLALPAATLNVP